MATHDYVLANQAGAAFRSDLNNALAAIVSQNSSATEPTTTYAYMPWFDTTNGILKFRNATNTGWVIDDLNSARGSVTMHATTMDIWAEPKIVDGTGSAVTITDIADAPQAGAVRILYPVAGTTITDGATFDVDGGANYTTAAGDALIFEAVTTSTFKVHIVKSDGTSIVNFPSQTGNSGKLLKTNGTSVSWDGAGVLSTLQVTTSGSAIDFTGIPSWVKRITVMLDEVSTTGTGLVQMRLGTSSGLETSGYKGAATLTNDASSVVGYSYPSVNSIVVDARATDTAGRCGAITLTLMNSSTNLWAISGNVAASASPLVCMTAGTKALAAKLDRLRIFTGDAFDVGAVNIFYE